MNRVLAISVVLLTICGVGRAAEQFASPAAVFTAIPEALRTPNGKWTTPQISNANEWLQQHVDGKSIGVIFTFGRLGKAQGQSGVHGTCPKDMPKELKELNFKGLFSGAADVAKLKKSKRGDILTCTGVIKHASISFYPRTNELAFNIDIDHAVLK